MSGQGESLCESLPRVVRGWRTVRCSIVAGLLVALAAESASAGQTILVKYAGDGATALDICAEELSRSGRSFAEGTRDRSDSLDRIHRRFSLRPARALFRAGDGVSARAGGRQSLERRRTALARRFSSAAAAAALRRGPSAGAALARAPRSSPTDLPDLAHVYRIEVPEASSVDAALAALNADPHVEYAQRDHVHRLDQAVPPLPLPPGSFDDPFLFSSGAWSQPYADLWGLHRVGAPDAWPGSMGEGVVVAVVDSGLDRFHPDIAGNVWVNPGEDLDGDGLAEVEDENGLDDDGNGFIDDLTGFDFANSVDADGDGRFDGPDDVSDADPFDDNGHGTHVAGTIAAVGGNGIGIVGVAPRARIMALKGFPAEGSASDSTLWRAVLYAAENGASVVNNSWSCGSPCPVNPLAEDVLEIVEALGVSVVTSAGNRSDDVVFTSPENGSRVLTVGAIGADDAVSSFSNTGWLVDVVAPGGGPEQTPGVFIPRRNILSLLSSGALETQLPFAVADDYLRLAGTSMSAPHVTGAVALLRSLRPELSPAQVRLLMRLAAEDLGEAGSDPLFGSGLLDLPALLAEPVPDLALELAAPRAGAVHDPAHGPVELRGRASGTDVVAFEAAAARGLTGRVFVPFETFARGSGGDDGDAAQSELLVRWDVSGVADGPHVLRVRAQLADGRVADDWTIVGLERNRPAAISNSLAEAVSDSDLDDARPSLSGTRVYWQRPDSSESVQQNDLFAGLFPSRREYELGGEPKTRALLVREGDQRSVVAEGRDLAWIARDGSRTVVEHCRTDSVGGGCVPRRATEAPGSMVRAFLAKGWLVWTRFDGPTRIVEGCRLEAATSLGSVPAAAATSAPLGPTLGGVETPICRPRTLLDPAAGSGWSAESFDGNWLLVSRSGSLARCRLGEEGGNCLPEAIGFPIGSAGASEPVLDGDLMAFSRLEVGPVWPPGCEPGVVTPECIPVAALLVEYQACWLDPVTQFCDPIAISEQTRIENARGIDVSGRRIVWSTGSDFERPAIRFCEFVPELGECEAQRLTGSPAVASRPAIEGERVVWEDARSGVVSIAGYALPRLEVVGAEAGTLRTTAGASFKLVLHGEPGFARSLAYELAALDGLPPELAKATIVPLDPVGRRAKLTGRFPIGSEGQARWRLRARTEKGLRTEQVVTLEVLPAPEASRSTSARTD